MIKEFRAFLLRGNVVDLAVGVVIGAAFSSIVNSLVKDIITPLIAALGGQPDFSKLNFTVNSSAVMYGNFLNALVSFVIIATAIFFGVVKPINTLIEKSNRSKKAEEPGTKSCPECLSDIPMKATRCSHCSVEVMKIT